MDTIYLKEVDSTNSYLKEHLSSIRPMTLVIAGSQTAGRGQRGNRWEAEPGKNLTLSFYFTPAAIHPSAQFVISEAIALAVVETLASYAIEAKVKWPNDIYVGDLKICGILIENSILGSRLSSSIIGAGLNVNQRLFVSDAPNPVSMTLLTGREYDLRQVAETLGNEIEKWISKLSHDAGREEIHERYLASLWRGEGFYPFAEAADGEKFMARISDIEHSGHLILRKVTGETCRYAFKEVVFII